jgi:hypothetical protein
MGMRTTIIKVGRKRKAGKRKPCGRLADRGENVAEIAQLHPDRQCLPTGLRSHQSAGTPLGRLNLKGHITDEQLEAGRKYARDVRLFQAVYGGPKPFASGIDPGAAGGQVVPIPLQVAEIARRIEAYDGAFKALWAAGQKASRAVARLAVYDEWLPVGVTLEHLQNGLHALVNHYGLTSAVKSGNVRNAG